MDAAHTVLVQHDIGTLNSPVIRYQTLTATAEISLKYAPAAATNAGVMREQLRFM